MSVPVIRLQIEQMKHTMMIALSDYTLELDKMLQASIEAYCASENIQRVMEEETRRVLDAVIREQVKYWFIYGEGREVIKKAVEQKLKDGTTYTPLD